MLPEWVTQPCPAISADHRDAAVARQGRLTKPTGALGRLETLAIELAGLQHTERRAPIARRSSSLPAIMASPRRASLPIRRK